MEWVRSGEYDRIVAGNYPRRGEEPPPSAEFDAAVDHYRERFCGVPRSDRWKRSGHRKEIQRLAQQIVGGAERRRRRRQ